MKGIIKCKRTTLFDLLDDRMQRVLNSVPILGVIFEVCGHRKNCRWVSLPNRHIGLVMLAVQDEIERRGAMSR